MSDDGIEGSELLEQIEIAVEVLKHLGQQGSDACARDRLASQQANHVAQIARSAMILATHGHEAALLILMRSLVDSIFRVAWGLSEDANASNLEIEANYKFRNDLKKLIERGNVAIPNPKTGRALTVGEIDLAGLVASKFTGRYMAEKMELLDVYLALYTPLSMHLHGSYSAVNPNPDRLEVTGMLQALAGAVQIVARTTTDWLISRKPPNPNQVRSYFFDDSGSR